MDNIIQMMMAAAGAGGEYEISRSLRFNSADSAYLSRTPASASNLKTWTWSCWLKRSALGEEFIFGRSSANNDSNFLNIQFTSTDTLNFSNWSGGINISTTQVFRDVGAWYHIVAALDTTQATSSDRFKFYVNGSQITALSVTTYPTQNSDLPINAAQAHRIGSRTGASTYLNGYLADINFIDGQALTPSSFGETDAVTGVWKPIEYTGTYGTNGFYLDFSDNTSTTTLGYDAAGSNDWTLNNFSVTAGAGNDSLVDSPTRYGTDTGAGGEVRGNYCTWNPLDKNNGTGFVNNGNLDASDSNTAGTSSGVRSTLGASSGKWYFEVTVSSLSDNSGNNVMIGVSDLNYPLSSAGWGSANAWTYYASSGNKYNGGSNSAYGAAYTQNDVIGVAVDSDNGTLTFYKNGVSQGQAYSGLTGKNLAPYFGTAFAVMVVTLNTGQRPFAYTAPSGFKALVTTNLPDPTVVQGDDYFNTVLYTGTGSSQNITGVGFQPDFVWIKERNGAADHALYDAVRGVQQQLESNTTTDETTESTGLTAFGSDGFTVGSLAQVNTSTDTYVAWNWKESTTSKFDIVTYTGNGTARTISHNLGVVPNMIIVKARTTASTDQGWPVYHSANTANPETDYLLLNSTAATADLDTVWNDTAPTSSVFSVGTNALVNANNDTYVAYVFANVAGYSAFGSYTGNGSADGPFVYTGFRPALIIRKRTDNIGDWIMMDNKRNTYNLTDNRLLANSSNAEVNNGNNIDILSNGWKERNADGYSNASGGTYIYMAFSQNPFKYALAR